MPKACEHGLSLRECFTCASPKHGVVGKTKKQVTQPSNGPEQYGYVKVIEVEKLLCQKLGRDWSAAGISIVSLVEELALRPIQTAQAEPEHIKCVRCGQPTMHIGNVCYSCNQKAAQAERVALKPLTVEQITAVVREASRGSAINREGTTSHRIAHAVITKFCEVNGLTAPAGGEVSNG